GDDARGRLRRGGGRALFGRRRLSLFLLAALRVHLLPLNNCVGDARGEEAHGTQRVVVSGDDVVNAFGRAVGVNDGDDGYAEAVGLLDGDVLLAHVYDEERVREARHVLDARQVLLKNLALAVELDALLLRQFLVATVGLHRFEV